jgi:predicted house-cleaning NTP pyrophosphatase (Maf/HAM1 superfamily)
VIKITKRFALDDVIFFDPETGETRVSEPPEQPEEKPPTLAERLAAHKARKVEKERGDGS